MKKQASGEENGITENSLPKTKEESRDKKQQIRQTEIPTRQK